MPRVIGASNRPSVPRGVLLRGVLRAGAIASVLALGAGCAGKPRAEGAAPRYPDAAAKAGVADIQVFRRGTRLQFTNSTARSFPASRLWINMRFSRAIDPLPVGARVDLDLREFVDHYGQAFRAGGFFSSEPPKPVVLAQIEMPGDDGAPQLVTLIVASDDSTQ
jgi:hypothetical protein